MMESEITKDKHWSRHLKLLSRPFVLALLLAAFNLIYTVFYESFFIYFFSDDSVIGYTFWGASILLLLIVFVEPFYVPMRKGLLNPPFTIVISLVIYCVAFFYNVGFAVNSPSDPNDLLGKDINVPIGMKITEVQEYIVPTHNNQPEQVKKGVSELNLSDSNMSGFEYILRGYVNAGEAGTLYLKGFEAVSGGPLSLEFEEQNAQWSEDSDEKFFFEFNTIQSYEGGKDYKFPARLEVWFKPSNGKTFLERILISKIFMIHGYDWRSMNLD